MKNELDVLSARCHVRTSAGRCWLAANHSNHCRGADGEVVQFRNLEKQPEPGPACAWDDLGSCDAERVLTTFAHDPVPRHLCRTHHENWVAYARWQDNYERDELCDICAKTQEDPQRCTCTVASLKGEVRAGRTAIAHWQEQYVRACGERDELKRVKNERREDAELVCSRCRAGVGKRASHYAGVPGHGILCPACHKELFP